ncbi:MAG: hypothetical protein QG652_343 [Pseudomonadota bacterium]|nr:hypothetical protein [Pseudomonadota bacterium]
MNNRKIIVTVLSGVLGLSCGYVLAADQLQTRDQTRIQDQTQAQTQDQEQIFGRQLMTAEEMVQYRNRMRAAKTAEEREQIRNEHHEQMKVRAKERGVTLPDEPPARGMGPGPGAGMGPGGGAGMGPGGGKR